VICPATPSDLQDRPESAAQLSAIGALYEPFSALASRPRWRFDRHLAIDVS